MFFKVSDRNSHALIEVNVTVHPTAIREMLTARDGAFRGFLRLVVFLALLYLSIGYEVTCGKYFPELGLHPTVLLLTYMAMNCSIGWTMVLAIICGALLDAGFAAQLGMHALLLAVATGAVAVLFDDDGSERSSYSWKACALCGACANGIFTFGGMLFRGNFIEFPEQVLLSTALAATAYMPVAAFLLNLFGRRKTAEDTPLKRQLNASEGI